MLNIVNLDVNGELHEIAVSAGEILTDTLRDKLGLTSVKKGCGVGECGACTVLIDGIAVNSCIYLTSWAEGKKIITVEGLRSKDNKLHPVQKALIEEAAIQCGFCTPGFIMTAVEIAGSGKKYTRDEIRRLISGHLCRCTGYENIINAIERVIAENNIRDESVV
ncbi:xanthine dehydrogenase subunit XdhC [Cloacibacillus evryensis]|uniref:xanthine dehydrogenase subunit XdhC n=1 Tax=Cloacibacillus evryensis TaxID=508460 RepID=UPI0022E86E09|nr:xanthine dehydrogenase subunit XdhC [Cloacibacillus evryensis]MEA5035121.1 xanthine dehydrogenase subunit XdhC [Cloacibacillus evryensis]